MILKNDFNRTYTVIMDENKRLYATYSTLFLEMNKLKDAVNELRKYPEYRQLLENEKFAEYSVDVIVDTELLPIPEEFETQFDTIDNLQLRMSKRATRSEQRLLKKELLDEADELRNELTERLAEMYKCIRELPKIAYEISTAMTGGKPRRIGVEKETEVAVYSVPKGHIGTRLDFERIYTNITSNTNHLFEVRQIMAADVRKYYCALEELEKYPVSSVYREQIEDIKMLALADARNPELLINYEENMSIMNSTYSLTQQNRSFESNVLSIASDSYYMILKNIKVCSDVLQEMTDICAAITIEMREEVEQEHTQEQQNEQEEHQSIFDKLQNMNVNHNNNDFEYSRTL